MKNWLFIGLFVSFFPTIIRTTHTSHTNCDYRLLEKNENICLKNALGDFFKKHPQVSRAMLIALSALETLAINSQMELLGIAQINSSRSGYIKHNLANTFPEVCSFLKIPIEKYTAPGPMVKATNIPALAVMGTLWGQNYFLAKKLHNTHYPAIESLLLTIGGHLLAWGIRFGWGII
jgi:hypothetical protein